MKKLQFLAFAALLVLPLAASAAVLPLPTPATIAADNTYTVPTDRGQSYNLNLKGTFAGATVSLQYFNPSGQTWDEMQSFTAPLSGFVHIAGNNEARLIVTGSTGTTNISAELFASAPLIPARPAVGADGSSSVVVQEKDGMMQMDTLASLNAVSAARDCTGYRSVSVMPTTSTINGQVIGEISNDATSWTSVTGYTPSNNGSSATSSAISNTPGQVYQFPTPAKYFRLRVSAYTSGSITVQSLFRSEPIPKIGVYVGGSSSGLNSVSIQGAIAAGQTATGNPIRNGVLASNSIGIRTSGQIADIPATLYGVPTQKPYSIPEFDWSYCPPPNGIVGSTAAVVIKAAAGAGLKNYITSATLMTNGPMGSATEFVILDGATPIFRLQIGTAGLQAGIDIDFPTPLRSSANAALSIQSTINTTGAILCNLQGYVAP